MALIFMFVIIGVPVVHILFQNLEEFLPPSLFGSSDRPNGSSVVYSTQVGDRVTTKQRSEALELNPISLKFTFNEVSPPNPPLKPLPYEMASLKT
jgi:hypothetical protein